MRIQCVSNFHNHQRNKTKTQDKEVDVTVDIHISTRKKIQNEIEGSRGRCYSVTDNRSYGYNGYYTPNLKKTVKRTIHFTEAVIIFIQEMAKTNYEWQIQLSNLEEVDYPLLCFEFVYPNKVSKEQYHKYWASNMYPKGSSLEHLKDRRLPLEEIRVETKAVGYLKMHNAEKVKYKFQKLIIQENHEDRSSESKIKCLEPRKQKTVYVPMDSLFQYDIAKEIELTGLEKFSYQTEFKKLMVIEMGGKILTVKTPEWKETHCSAVLWDDKVNMNERLETMMTLFEKHQKKQMIRPDKWGFPSSLCSIKTEIDSWMSENPPSILNTTLIFHVSKLVLHEKKWATLIIHPAKYWGQFRSMEKDLQEYGKNLPQLGCSYEEKGQFLVAARLEKEDKEMILKFYRGMHTGEVSIAGGTHKIAILDYPGFLWVANGNMMPLLPQHSYLPAMGGTCKPIVSGKFPETAVDLRDLRNQHCKGKVEELKYFEELFPVFTISDIKVVPPNPFSTLMKNFSSRK